MAGQPHEVVLRLHGDQPSEDDLAAWMRDGSVVRLQVSETGSHSRHIIVLNFTSVAFAWLVPYKGGRGVNF
jgi:hypothetical protein